MQVINMNEKLNDKIKALNSSRVYKKITPRHDLSWYVKWASSVLSLLAVASRATGTLPMFDLWFSLIGTVGWFTVGMLWHDRAIHGITKGIFWCMTWLTHTSMNYQLFKLMMN